MIDILCGQHLSGFITNRRAKQPRSSAIWASVVTKMPTILDNLILRENLLHSSRQFCGRCRQLTPDSSSGPRQPADFSGHSFTLYSYVCRNASDACPAHQARDIDINSIQITTPFLSLTDSDTTFPNHMHVNKQNLRACQIKEELVLECHTRLHARA